RSLRLAIMALVASSSAREPEQSALLQHIFNEFFRDPDVARELSVILRGDDLDLDELLLIFTDLDFDAATLPGLQFREGLLLFQGAFQLALSQETSLQPLIQTSQSFTQTRLQREIRDLLRQLVAANQEQGQTITGIQAGVIQAQNVVSGTQIIYEWPGSAPPHIPAGTGALTHYLKTLYQRCNTLDLPDIEDIGLGSTSGLVSLDQVFTTLYLAQE
ncbi:MAG: hypothetical protein KDE34_28785, partial [Anaerolineales bacterium]|nr:hypothetical protein [Anaerolineales bacterium]